MQWTVHTQNSKAVGSIDALVLELGVKRNFTFNNNTNIYSSKTMIISVVGQFMAHKHFGFSRGTITWINKQSRCVFNWDNTFLD